MSARRVCGAAKILGLSTALASVVAPTASVAGPPTPLDQMAAMVKLQRSMIALNKLDVVDARGALDGLSDDEPTVARMRALIAVYEGHCDDATDLLARPSVAAGEGALLAEVARGCAKGTAGAVLVHDARGVDVRVKDDEDEPLVPFIVDVAEKSMAALERDLGVKLPRPLRIELVRDHYTLSEMTGLPEQAAMTTGTVAIAKWGCVTMLSPRAVPHGYPWADSLMHELTHLAVTRASADRAPLWLQEGIAKREELRWRDPLPFDGVPSADSVAQSGFRRNLATPIDALGPSLAMLPSAERAAVAYAEVQSFVGYWAAQMGDGALPKLLDAMSTTELVKTDDPVDLALRSVSQASLHDWSERWKVWLDAQPVPPIESTNSTPPSASTSPHDGPLDAHPRRDLGRDLGRTSRLSELLSSRDHPAAALSYATRAAELAPRDPAARARYARTLHALARPDDARRHLGELDQMQMGHGVWFALEGERYRSTGSPAAGLAFDRALWFDPLAPEVACEMLVFPSIPSIDTRARLCAALRHVRRD